MNAIPLKLYKMNEIVNTFLLVDEKFMPEMHLRQPGFTYSVCGPYTKNKERIQKFKETGDTNYIYKNELNKACFQHDMAYGDFKDLAKRTAADKVLRDKAFKITSDQKYDGYQRGLASFRDNIWGVDLVDMQLLSKFNKGFRFLLCVIDIFSKYAWVISLKDKKGISIVNAFQKILDDSKRKPDKIWVYKGSKFYNNSFKKWLKDNDIVMYSTNNEKKSVIAERFIRKLKNKVYK